MAQTLCATSIGLLFKPTCARLLTDIAAQTGMPIDLHMEAVPRDGPMPELILGGPNPRQLRENISGRKRLLEHNSKANIVWVHAGWNLTGERTVNLCARSWKCIRTLF